MSDIVGPLLEWLNANPELAGLATFLISAAESVAIIGTIVPGSITMTAIGTLAGAGVIPLWGTIFWAILGAVVGDGISYWLGHYFKDRLRYAWPFRSYPALLDSGEKFVHKYGVMSVFIGRFVGPVRALVPLVAGMLGMRPLHFTIANVLSAIGWAPAYLLPGILLGAASLELPPDIAVHVILVLMLIVLFIILCIWVIYKILKLFTAQTNQMQNWIWHGLKKRKSLRPVTYMLKHHDAAYTHGQLNLFFYALFTALLFLLVTYFVMRYGAASIGINDSIFHLFRGIRSPGYEKIMVAMTLLGQKQVLFPVVVGITLLLFMIRRFRIAIHFIMLTVLTSGSIFVLKHMIRSERPGGIFTNLETYSMPSGHATLAMAMWLGFIFFGSRSLSSRQRGFLYGLGLIIVFLVGVSRLYLGAHWFTDVLAGWLLGATIVMVTIISYQRRFQYPLQSWKFFLISLMLLALSYSVFAYRKLDQLVMNYTPVAQPVIKIDMNVWWLNNHVLPAYRVSLFGFPSQRINIMWEGSLEEIRETLLKEGWNKPPARDLVSTLHRIADVRSTEYLPMISPQYVDEQPQLTLARFLSNQKRLMVIRLWDSKRQIRENNQPLWVGTVSVVPRSYSWLYRSHPSELQIQADYVFPLEASQWKWKIVDIDLHDRNKKIEKQKIMLIRSSAIPAKNTGRA